MRFSDTSVLKSLRFQIQGLSQDCQRVRSNRAKRTQTARLIFASMYYSKPINGWSEFQATNHK